MRQIWDTPAPFAKRKVASHFTQRGTNKPFRVISYMDQKLA
jgi:hypothetical protein